MKRIIAFSIIALTFLASCVKEQQVEVLPDFVTDKEVYGINEPVKITNTTIVKNSVAAITKWEFAGKVFYGETPEGVKFSDVGEYPVTLTVTANDGFVKQSCTKKITVMDTNIRPVVDFSWNPTTVKAGDVVQFTDLSTDEDGTIVAWEWVIGSGTSTEQNPSYEFVEYGEVEVTLTVTDNMYGKSSATKTITVAPGKYRLDLNWKKTYDANGAFTRFTSPAMTADGTSGIYVTSSGGKLVKFDREGNQLWAYDYATQHNTVYANTAGTSEVPVVTPSVDTDGTIYFAAGYNQPGGDPAGKDNGIFALTPEGTLKWYTLGGQNTRFGWHSPLILKDCIATTQTHAGRTTGKLDDQGCAILYKDGGTVKQTIYATSGSNGGICAYNDKIYVNTAGSVSNGGTNVGFLMDDSKWYLTNNSGTNTDAALRPGEARWARSCQPAITANGEILLLYPASANDASAGGVLYCYDDAAVVHTTKIAPAYKWKREIPGYLSSTVTSTSTAATECGGHGAAIASDGKIYVTTRTSITALSPSGEILWSHNGGSIECVPAIDNLGCIYYTDSQSGSVIKLNAAGQKLAAIGLSAKLTSSVTIAEDGRLYVVGLENGAPTLFALSTNDIQGPATGWSQLSGGPCKRSSVYTE